MALQDLRSSEAVASALGEFDSLGREAFLAKYGFAEARSYFLVREGKKYDAKAIVGAAHGFEHPDLGPLTEAQFSGGDAAVKRKLEAVGFKIERIKVSREEQLLYPSPALVQIVGLGPLARHTLVERIWAYVKEHDLQDKARPRYINADRALEAVFGGKKTVTMFEMTALVNKNISGAPYADMQKTSASLRQGEIYTREALTQMFGITDATIKTGLFKPKGHDSVWLFITEKKTSDRTQYADKLEGDTLTIEGQTQRRTDDLLIHHEERGLEVVLFYRHDKREHPGAGFRYEGPFVYDTHHTPDAGPSRFTLHRATSAADADVDDDSAKEALEVIAASRARRQGGGQGFSGSREANRAIELYAQDRAQRHFEGDGYSVEVKGKPYDLLCKRGAETLYVEVKGTRTIGEQILLTPNEVRFARTHQREMVLFLVSGIKVGDDKPIVCSGGEHLVLERWAPGESDLSPTGYSCKVSRGV